MSPVILSLRCAAAFMLVLGVLTLLPGRAQSQAADEFNPGTSRPGSPSVNALAVQADGKIVVGGNFTQIDGQPRFRIARLNTNGTVDTSFDAGTVRGNVRALAVQADGRIVVGGNFFELGGQPRNSIGRLHADGTVDLAFNPGASGGGGGTFATVFALALQTDGQILVGGDFTQLGGQPRNLIGRLHTTGMVDLAFNPGAGGSGIPAINAIAIHGDGRIVVGGDFTELGGLSRTNIGRLHANGIPDNDFNPGANSTVRSLAVQLIDVDVQRRHDLIPSDEKILVGGTFVFLNGQLRINLGRLNPDGTLDTAFNPGVGGGGLTSVSALTVDPDGEILFGGSFSQIGGQPRTNIARLDMEGALDATFNAGPMNGAVFALARQPDGKLVVGGNFTQLGGQPRNGLGRLKADGTLDSAFHPEVTTDSPSEPSALAVQGDGKIVVGGSFTQLGGQPRNFLGRLNPDGTLDAAFNPGVSGPVHALALQADGRIVVGGIFAELGGEQRLSIGRLNPDGTLDSSFNPGAGGLGLFSVFTLAEQADGKILVGGNFTQLGGQPRSRLGRLNADGTLDRTFNPGASGGDGFNSVRALVVQADGKIVVGGDFTQLAGQPRHDLGRLNDDGTLDTAFDPGVSGGNFPVVNVLAVQADGKIVVGGQFAQLAGSGRTNIGRLHPDGALDASFNVGAVGGTIYAITGQVDGKMIIGGLFVRIAGQMRDRLARLNPDGTLDTTFNAGASGSMSGSVPSVRTLVLQADGKLLVGGDFTQLAGQPRNNLGRLTNPDAALQHLSVDSSGSTIRWLRSGSSPEVDRVAFELSTDGVNYTHLGDGTRITGGWQLGGLSLPTAVSFTVRARTRTTGGGNGSSGLIESVAEFHPIPHPLLTAPTVLANGSFQFSFTNTSGAIFSVLATTNAALPAPVWEVLDPPVPVGGGIYQFTDSTATNFTQRFYQLRSP